MPAEQLHVRHNDRFDHLKKMNASVRDVWISHELKFWNNIAYNLSLQHTDSIFFEAITSYVDILKLGGKNIHAMEKFENFHNSQPLPFHDEKPECDVFPHLAENEQFDVALYSFQASLKNSTKAYTKAYAADLNNIEQQFKNHITSEKNNFSGEIAKRVEDLNNKLDKTEKENLETLALELKKTKIDINNTLTATNKAILSAEPVQYWEDREKKHREKAKIYKKYLIGTAIFFIALLTYLTISVHRDEDTYVAFGIPITLPAEKISIALIIIITTGAIWLTRVLVKLMMTNLALEIEALERSTMIKTYIAMDNAKAEQAQEIRMLFYSTLFKPSNNNLADDSTSPEYIKIIEAMLQKKTPDKT